MKSMNIFSPAQSVFSSNFDLIQEYAPTSIVTNHNWIDWNKVKPNTYFYTTSQASQIFIQIKSGSIKWTLSLFKGN